MNRGTLDWLLACPSVEGVSALAVDIHREGLLPLERELARAIARSVSEAALGAAPRLQPPLYHERAAMMYATRIRGQQMAIVKGVAVMRGRLLPGVGISELPGQVALHLRATVPDTIVMAAPGQPLRDLIGWQLFKAERFEILSAHQARDGLTIWIKTSRPPVPLATLATDMAG